MKNKIYLVFIFAVLFLVASSLSSALIINSVDSDDFSPGGEGSIRIEVENNLNNDVKDVYLVLKFIDLPFIPIGSSEQSFEEIEEDDEEIFLFRIKASNDVVPGDYEIPYMLSYTLTDEDRVSRSGSIGVKIIANPDLTFTINTPEAIENRKGQISLRIVNKGFYDARFVSVRVLPSGFTLLSEEEVYIGSVDSDDFETANFNVIYNKQGKTDFQALIEYTDFNNKKITQNINLPITVYSQEKAIELGIIQQNRTSLYIGTVVLIIVLIIVWRTFKKRMRLRKSQQQRTNGGAK